MPEVPKKMFRRGHGCFLTLSCALALLLAGTFLPLPAPAQVASRISAQVVDSQVTRIKGSTHPAATSANDRGVLQTASQFQKIVLVLKPSDAQQAALNKMISDLHDSKSGSYHKWLTPEQFGALYGPSDKDIETVQTWLRSHNMKIESVAKGRQWIQFSGSSSDVQTTFGTSMHSYMVDGVKHIANATDLSIPSALTPVVSGVVSLNDFFSKSYLSNSRLVKRQANGKFALVADTATASSKATVPASVTVPTAAAGTSTPAFTFSDNSHAVSPGDLARIYNTQPLLANSTDGSGVSIAVVARSNIQLSDVEIFRKFFNLPDNDPEIDLIGPDPGTGSNDELESDLDVEYAGAVAPKAKVKFVIEASTDTSDGIDLAAAYIVDNAVAPIVTLSYGACEAFIGTAGNAFHNLLWEQAAAEGMTVLVSAGDSGSAGCDASSSNVARDGLAVNGLSSTAYNVSVGGTMFTETAGNAATYWQSSARADYSDAIGYIPETTWNESCNPRLPYTSTNCAAYIGSTYAYQGLYTGGGGRSSCTQSTSTTEGYETVITCDANSGNPKPGWQTGVGVPADGVRDLPDVSLTAAANKDPYLICTEGSCQYTLTDDGTIQIETITEVGGTSASAPAMAGILALVEQKNGVYLGQVNYTLYQLAARDSLSSCNATTITDPTQASSCVFHDITSGSNSVSCTSGSPNCGTNGYLTDYAAGEGYDLATGLGSVDATNLANLWNSAADTPSTTTFAMPTTTATHGQPLSFTASVAPASGTGVPTGDISLKPDIGNSSGPFLLTKGAFAGDVSDLPGGTHTITAFYPGDATYAPSTSESVTVNIQPEVSTTIASLRGYDSNGNITTITNTNYGESILLRGDVAGHSGKGTPSGLVTFTVDGKSYGSYGLTAEGAVALAAGAGSPQQFFFNPGTHTFSVSYAGDSSFNASVSTPSTFMVNKGLDYSLISSRTQITDAEHLFLTAYILSETGGTPLVPTGTIQLQDNGVNIGVPLKLASASATSSGGAMATTSLQLSAGTHTLSIVYGGDNNFSAPQFSISHTVTVTHAAGLATKTGIAPDATRVDLNGTVTYSIQVVPQKATTLPAPTGTVTLYGQTGQLSYNLPTSATLGYEGSALIQFQWQQGGAQLVYASYSGDSNYAPSTSPIITTTVLPGTPVAVLTAPAAYVTPGAQTPITITLIGSTKTANIPSPLGQVQFFDSLNGGAPQSMFPPVSLSQGNGQVNFAATSIYTFPAKLAAGTHVITAKYLGTVNWNAVNSNSVTIIATNPDFTLSTASPSITVPVGGAGSGMIQVSPILGFGSDVTLSCGSGLPVGVTCAFSPATVSAGSGATTLTLNAPTTATTTAFIPAHQRLNSRLLGTGLSLAGLLLLGSLRRRRIFLSACVLLLSALGISAIGCGGNSITPTTLNLTTSQDKAASGAVVTLTASLTDTNKHAVSGSVVFYDGTTVIGEPAAVVDGSAKLDISTLRVGIHSITASYSGDQHTAASKSAAVAQSVTGSTTLTVNAVSGSLTHATTIAVVLQ